MSIPMRTKYEAGQTYERWTPFIVEDRELHTFDEDGGSSRTIKSWRPGVKHRAVGPEDSQMEWDGAGAEVRRIVGIASIEGGGSRILYRRTWRRPDGGEFGKATVRMTTPSGFTAWRTGSGSSFRRELEYQRREIGELEAV